jgi:hypothetical protein
MVLNWLCSIGMKTVSWILVLLPYLMLFLSAGFVMDMMHSKEGFYQSLILSNNLLPKNYEHSPELYSNGKVIQATKRWMKNNPNATNSEIQFFCNQFSNSIASTEQISCSALNFK